MSLKKDESGRRSVQVEVVVPGTPEQVWQAIATGPGVSSWFVPTEMREDGTVVANFGPGMESTSRVTEWDPPRRFAAESGALGPSAPPVATEWIVEARSGGTCVVRVVHSLFASTEDWDNQLEAIESGWPWFFQVLRLYLTHFGGLPCAAFQLMGVAPEPRSTAWEALIGSFGLAGVAAGQRWNTSAGAPLLAGLVEQVGTDQDPHALLLRLEEPSPGLASLSAHVMGGQVYLVIGFYLYGDRAAAVVSRDEPLWQAWMKERFPPAGDAGQVA